MKPSISSKLAQLSERLDEVNSLLSSEEATRDMDVFPQAQPRARRDRAGGRAVPRLAVLRGRHRHRTGNGGRSGHARIRRCRDQGRTRKAGTTRSRTAKTVAAERPQRRAQRVPRSARRHRRRRSGDLRGRHLPHVYAFCRTPPLAGRNHFRESWAKWAATRKSSRASSARAPTPC